MVHWSGWIVAFVSVALVPGVPAVARAMAPGDAPAAWVRYAEAVTVAVQRWLQPDSETAQRLRAYLDGTRSTPYQPTAPIQLKLWIDGEGSVLRIEYPLFVHVEANEDIRTLIVGQRLPGAPPKGMLLPLRILLRLDSAPQGPAPDAESAPSTRASPLST